MKENKVKTLKNSQKGDHFHEVADNEPENLLKYELVHRYFQRFCLDFRNTCFREHPQMALHTTEGSEINIIYMK